MEKEGKDVLYENTTRPQIVSIIKMNNTELQYQVVKATTNNLKNTFICSINRFNNLYVKI
jgi:hypothetical protein